MQKAAAAMSLTTGAACTPSGSRARPLLYRCQAAARTGPARTSPAASASSPRAELERLQRRASPPTSSTVAFTGANILRWSASAFVLILLGAGLWVVGGRRGRTTL